MAAVLGSRSRPVDAGLTALMLLQGITLFAAIPFASEVPGGYTLLDACHLVFTLVCIWLLTRRRLVQVLLLAILVTLALGPVAGRMLSSGFVVDPTDTHEAIALVAFTFNAVITILVASHVFAAGRVTAHRVRGAILLYLNTSAMFAILYGAIAMLDPGAFAAAGHAVATAADGGATATFSYFSLATITTTGYGDIVPVHALARSLANLEAVIGQLFPATLLSRLVALHLAHEQQSTVELISDG